MQRNNGFFLECPGSGVLGDLKVTVEQWEKACFSYDISIQFLAQAILGVN
jgi:hypothetical protein